MKSLLTVLTILITLMTTACNPIGGSDQNLANNTCDPRICDPAPQTVASNDLCTETHCDPKPDANPLCDERNCDPQPQLAANPLCTETHCDPQPTV